LIRQLKKNKINFIEGRAFFQSPDELHVLNQEGSPVAKVKAARYLIATGSEPRNPLHVPFDSDVILDSTRLLAIGRVPKTMLVLGGGVIGTEYASFFTALGTKVTILDKKDRLLPVLDAEIGTHFQVGLQEEGLVFVPRKEPKQIIRENNHAKVICQDLTEFEAEILLYALGREANVASLGLKLPIAPTGYLQVNDYFQTIYPHIYAAGDVIGYPALASTSMEQGRLAARHAFGAKTHPFPTFFPLGIYAIPEISCCGKTEEDLEKEGVDYGVGRAYYYEIARSHITGSSQLGLFKMLFDKKTLKILGVHIVGRNATELIHIGQIGMSFGATLDYFVDQVFNYPTFAEGYRIAAFNGLNKMKEQ
jgi:NAD(P) transhydrogenase